MVQQGVYEPGKRHWLKVRHNNNNNNNNNMYMYMIWISYEPIIRCIVAMDQLWVYYQVYCYYGLAMGLLLGVLLLWISYESIIGCIVAMDQL